MSLWSIYVADNNKATRSETRIRQVYTEIEEKAQEMGLTVNETKTKYLTISTRLKRRQIQNLTVGDKIFEASVV
jgi:hypothetical protein